MSRSTACKSLLLFAVQFIQLVAAHWLEIRNGTLQDIGENAIAERLLLDSHELDGSKNLAMGAVF